VAGKRLVALIRGINVGRAKRVAMADLRAMMEGLGYGGCRTLLNSGNVIFTGGREAPAAAAARIEKAMAAQLGVSARVLVVTADDVETVVAENPLGKVAKEPSRLLVMFLEDAAALQRVKPLSKQDWKPEALGVGSRAAYIWCPEGVIDSRLLLGVGKALGEAALASTTRNWATVLKIQALL
jgi:uncharacterized protein (DUF1697 family)